MATLTHHLERARAQPHHVRKQMTFIIALGVTALIALLWIIYALTSGAFAIQGTSFAESAAGASDTASAASGRDSFLASPFGAGSASQEPATLEVVGGSDAAATGPAASPKVIPF